MEIEHNSICHKRFATERTCKLLANAEAEMFVNKILRMGSARLFNGLKRSTIMSISACGP